MKLKRVLAALLTAALLTATLPSAAAAPVSAFSDITDPVLAEQVEFLRLMGVVDGMGGGRFEPSGTFTRAQVTKMAICALGRRSEEVSQRNRTIFQDVLPSHWANGYINLASTIKLGSGDNATALMMGVGNSTFAPDRNIKYGEVVAILCRMLGYSDADVLTGGKWYDGYLATARAAGLTGSLALDGEAAVTRAQAATLFYNLYFTNPKDSDKTYLVSLGGSDLDAGVVLDVNATADDGTTGCFRTTTGTYKTDRAFDTALEGQEGRIILNADGKLVAFRQKAGTSGRTVTATTIKSAQIVTSTGEKLTVDPDTVVYRNGEATTWSAVYSKLPSITSVTFHYGQSGKLAYLFLGGSAEERAAVMVARSAPRSGVNPFSSLAGGGTYTMYKNGLPATATDIRQYDVATWEPSARVIQVSDLKLTGVYEDASPSPSDPATVKLMGREFDVLPAAREDLAAFKIGSQITLLLTVDNKVAGAVASSVVRGTPVGLASIDGTDAKVTLLEGGLVVEGTVSSDRYDDQLVTVSSSAIGKLTLSAVSSSTAKGALDVSAGTLGDKTVASNVTVYDRARNGKLTEVDYETLPARIAKDKISFALYDYADRVKCLVLDDVTGDAYEYGYLYFRVDTIERDDATFGKYQYEERYITLTNSVSTGKEYRTLLSSVRSGVPGGVATNAKGWAASTIELAPLTGVKSSAIDPEAMTVTVAGVAYPIFKDVQVYNRTTRTWLSSGQAGVEAARVYADALNLYYDRSPDEGGKIRMIVIP